MIRWYARALKGERARGDPPSFIFPGVVASTNLYGPVNGATFEAFVAKKLVL